MNDLFSLLKIRKTGKTGSLWKRFSFRANRQVHILAPGFSPTIKTLNFQVIYHHRKNVEKQKLLEAQLVSQSQHYIIYPSDFNFQSCLGSLTK